jgi:hypothetical protein
MSSICEVCGATRVKLTGRSRYIGCPNGHGRLHLAPPHESKPRGRPREGLPLAELTQMGCGIVPCEYTLADLPGKYQRFRQWVWKGIGRTTPGEIVRARLNGATTRFVKIKEKP